MKLTPIALVAASLLLACVAGAWLYNHRAMRDADAKLQALPIYQVLKRHEPELYLRLVERYQASLDGKISAAEYTNYASGEISGRATGRLMKASDPAVNALILDMLDNARALAKQPGDACFRYLFPDVSGPPDVARYLDAAAQARTQDRLAAVIRTAHESPVESLPGKSAADQMDQVINGMYQRFGADTQVMAHTNDPGVDRAKVCAITIALYERVMDRPPADSAALIRAMTGTP